MPKNKKPKEKEKEKENKSNELINFYTLDKVKNI